MDRKLLGLCKDNNLKAVRKAIDNLKLNEVSKKGQTAFLVHADKKIGPSVM